MINEIKLFSAQLREEIAKELENKRGHVAAHRCKTFDEYHFLCGSIQGLEQAERLITDLVQAVENSE
jgi:hypothetical protein